MFKHSLFVVCFIVWCHLAPALYAQTPPAASVNGKYSNLLQVLNCPSDSLEYGNYRDYGYWAGGAWCGQSGKPGYWVWLNPNWYVWGQQGQIRSQQRIQIPAAASANGKYTGLMQTINCPSDQAQYGNFRDYGYWKGGAWCGQTGKPGFWVWVNPKWYVWSKQKAAVPTQPRRVLRAAPSNASAQASLNGKYSNLLQVLNCPSDSLEYGNFRDYGYWKGGVWCGQTGKAGYWVWLNPNWYVWGRQGQAKMQQRRQIPAAASVNGKYKGLLQVLNCPSDQAQYGNYRDYGYWSGGAWCGKTGKAGHWVWVYPNWYVWQGLAQ